MRLYWNSAAALLLCTLLGARAQSSYYKRTYYTPSVSPSRSYFEQRNSGFVPMTYHGDLLSAESKYKEAPKKYSKKIPFRPFSSEEDDLSQEVFTSGEYSNESHGFNSKENDSREYSIGTQIRVQHPITVPHKSTSSSSSSSGPSYSKHHKYTQVSPYKGSTSTSTSYAEVNHSGELHSPERPTKKHVHKYKEPVYESDPFHLVPPPKSSGSGGISTSSSYKVYEPEQDDLVGTLPAGLRRDRYKSIASKKQIDAYLKDQQKLLGEALKIQLLKDPDYQQFLKAKLKEQRYNDDDLYEHDSRPNSPPPPPPSHYRHNFDDSPPFKTTRPRRRPHAGELKRSPKPSPKRKFRSALVISV